HCFLFDTVTFST
ncbi:hypothetical protein EC880221_0512, partial [Escherichia coli 88.0221]